MPASCYPTTPPDFRMLFESAPGSYLVLTPDLVIVAVSDAYLQATMTRREQILSRPLFDVFPDNPDDPTATGVRNLRESLQRVLRHRVPDAMAVQKYDIRRPEAEGGGFEERHWSPVNSPVLRSDGELVYIIHRVEDVTEIVRLKRGKTENEQTTQELRHRTDEMKSEILLWQEEIAERKRVEAQLRQNEERLHAVFENMREGVAISNLDGQMIYWNQAAQEMHGLASADEWRRLLPEFKQTFELSTLEGRVLKFEDWPMPRILRGERLCNYELLVRRTDLSWRRVLSYGGGVVLDAAGRRVVFCTVIDITERTKREEDLRHSEEQFRLLVDNTIDGIISFNEQGTVSLFSRPAERIFQYEASEVVGQNIKMLLSESSQNKYDRYLKEHFFAAKVKSTGIGGDIEGRRKDGTIFPLDLAVTEFTLNRQQQFLGIVRDISSQKKLEEQLRQAQKMEAVGQLAGGVAHDFNNLLTVINGYSDLLMDNLAPNDPFRATVGTIQEAGERAASLTRQLLAFSRQSVLAPKVLNLNELIRQTEKFLRRLIGEDVILTTVLHSHLGQVKVDPGQFNQVLMNLSINARDAMPRGGQLTIETQNVNLPDNYTDMQVGVRAGKYVMVAVSDTGGGMTSEVKAHAFEPFYTTKGVGKGTGLGLSVVHGIVKQSGGHIEVYSKVNLGTTFKLYFPRVEQQEKSADNIAESIDLRGTGTILLVEDEDAVRKLAQIVLQTHGYHVLTAEDGLEALRVVDLHAGPIDMLITDVVMPRMGGRELAEVLQPRFPQMKVLFTSGYTDDAVVRHGILEADVSFLQKPYTPEGLARKVRAILDKT